MAEMIPMSRTPGYGASFGQQAAQFDANAADRLKAQLDNRTAALGHILGNIEDIAAVSGSGALDPLGSAYAGQTAPIYGTDYAQSMDNLNMQMRQAQVAAMNRSGRGGGGGGGGSSDDQLKPGLFVGHDGRLYKWSDYDTITLASKLGKNSDSAPKFGGPLYNPPGANEGQATVVDTVDDTDAAGPTTLPDGSLVFPDGSRINPDGTLG